MLHVHHAGRAERLVDALVELLSMPPDDPFTPEVVAVPSRGVQRWLEQQLARRLGTSTGSTACADRPPIRADGVAANIHMPFPGRLLQPVWSAAGGQVVLGHTDLGDDPWRPGPLTWRILHVAPEAGVPLAGAARARHVAELFDRYAVYRPALLHGWASGRDHDADGLPLDPAMQWQPALWRAVAASLAARTPDPAARLRAAVSALEDQPALADLPDRVCVVALGALPASSLVVLDALATHREMHVLLLHPSPVWWRSTAATAVPPGLPPHPRTTVVARHPLLSTWGQVAFETQQALRAGSDGGERPARWYPLDLEAGEPREPEPREPERHGPDPHGPGRAPTADPGSLLHRLQLDVRLDRPPAEGPVHVWDPADRSVQVHGCHGFTRQVEVLRDTIAHLLADEEAGLVPADVLVLCTDLDRARPVVQSVLGPVVADGHHPSGVPRFALTMADGSTRSSAIAPGSVDDAMVDGLLTVLRTARGRSTATTIAALAALAPVRRRLGFTDVDLARLDTWIEAANVRWGLDAAHLAEHGLPDEVAVTSWEAALDRLLLGLASSPDEHRIGIGDRRPSPAVGLDDAPGIGRLAELVHRIRVLRPLLAERAPASVWADLLRDIVDTFLAADPGQPWQSRRLERLLYQVDTERAVAGPDVDPELGLDDVLALLAAAWHHGGGGAHWGSGGITVCSLGELRGVPFPVVCILGLDDDAVRAAVNPPDDLLTRAPRTGDRDARSEQRALLLDAVLAARQHLVITHDGHDVRTNQALAPAVPLAELLDVIDLTTGTEPGATAVDAPDGDRPLPTSRRLVVHHPRQAFAEACLRPGMLGLPGPWSFDPEALAGARIRRQGRAVPSELCDLLLPAAVDPGDVVALADLCSALCNPVGSFLERGLGLRLPRTPEERVDLVPTALEALPRWQLGQHLLDVRARPDLDPDAADALWLRLARADGLLPAGRFADRAIGAARAQVGAIVAELAGRGLPLRGGGTVDVDVELPGGRRVAGSIGGVHGGTLVRVRAGDVRAKDVLPARLELLALAASGHTFDAVLVGANSADVVHEQLRVMGDQQTARAALAALVDLSVRCTRSALPVPAALAAQWADALHHPKRNTKTPSAAWRYDQFTPANVVVFGQFDEHTDLAERRALDDGTPAPQLAQVLWRLLEGVPG